MMFEREYIIIDPLGDQHVRRVAVPDGGNWHRRSYKDEYYPIHMLGGNPYRDKPELLYGRRAY